MRASVFLALVSNFTRREKISVTSAVSDQSQFTLHIRRRHVRVFLCGSRANAANMAEDALRKEWDVFGLERFSKHQALQNTNTISKGGSSQGTENAACSFSSIFTSCELPLFPFFSLLFPFPCFRCCGPGANFIFALYLAITLCKSSTRHNTSFSTPDLI